MGLGRVHAKKDNPTECIEKFYQLLTFFLAEWWRHRSGGWQKTVWKQLSGAEACTLYERELTGIRPSQCI